MWREHDDIHVPGFRRHETGEHAESGGHCDKRDGNKQSGLIEHDEVAQKRSKLKHRTWCGKITGALGLTDVASVVVAHPHRVHVRNVSSEIGRAILRALTGPVREHGVGPPLFRDGAQDEVDESDVDMALRHSDGLRFESDGREQAS